MAKRKSKKSRKGSRPIPAFDQKALDAVQSRVGHQFADESLLHRALTHSSLSTGSGIGDLERLEFLGDRVLGLLTADALWRRFPDQPEGELAPRLNALVRKETCANAAVAFGLNAAIRLSPHEEEAGGRKKTTILGDVCEAFLGALYIDGGLDAAGRAYDLYWIENFDRLWQAHRDAKTALQEWSQDKGRGTPSYKTKKTDGPAHAPGFLVEVSIEGGKAEGEGSSKRSAQSAAAAALLIKEGVWTEHND